MLYFNFTYYYTYHRQLSLIFSYFKCILVMMVIIIHLGEFIQPDINIDNQIDTITFLVNQTSHLDTCSLLPYLLLLIYKMSVTKVTISFSILLLYHPLFAHFHSINLRCTMYTYIKLCSSAYNHHSKVFYFYSNKKQK